jgi:hypothetical protein
MTRKTIPPTAPDDIAVNNKLSTVVDTKRAADLFARILRAVREQTAEDARKRNSREAA